MCGCQGPCESAKVHVSLRILNVWMHAQPYTSTTTTTVTEVNAPCTLHPAFALSARTQSLSHRMTGAHPTTDTDACYNEPTGM
jgi:hypothetical protein